MNEKRDPSYSHTQGMVTMNFYSPCECGDFKARVTESHSYEFMGVTVCSNCGCHEPKTLWDKYTPPIYDEHYSKTKGQ